MKLMLVIIVRQEAGIALLSLYAYFALMPAM